MPKNKNKTFNGGSSRSSKPSLLEGDWFTHKCQTALEQTFARFDTDCDGALNVAELQAFARVCNGGEPFDDDEIDQIGQFFETNDANALTRKGFLQMYHTQTVARPSDTWKDLSALGFNNQLERAEAFAEEAAILHAPATPSAGSAAAAAATERKEGGGAAHVAALCCSQSDDLYTEGKHAAALKAALSALQADDSCADAHRCAGRALFALGRVDAAERAWAKANAASNPPNTSTSDAKQSEAESGAGKEEAVEGVPGEGVPGEGAPTAAGKSKRKKKKKGGGGGGGGEGGGEGGGDGGGEGGGEEGGVDGDGVAAGELPDVSPPTAISAAASKQLQAATGVSAKGNVVVRVADYTNAEDARLLGELLDGYAADPLGDGEHLPVGIVKKLASCLKDVPGAFSVLAWVDGIGAIGFEPALPAASSGAATHTHAYAYAYALRVRVRVISPLPCSACLLMVSLASLAYSPHSPH